MILIDENFKGVYLPKDIAFREDLNHSEKWVLAFIIAVSKDNILSCKNEDLAKSCSCSVPTICRAIKKFKDAGDITILKNDGRGRTFKINHIKNW